MSRNQLTTLDGLLLDEDACVTLAELCQACNIHAEWVMGLVDEGIIDPVRRGPTWQFSGNSLRRVMTIRHLQRDLDVNLAGAALALELLEEVNRLRNRLRILESD